VVRVAVRGDERGGEHNAGKTYEAIDDAGRRVGLAEIESEDFRDEVKLGDGDEPPVEGADDGQNAGSKTKV